jgi:hypothetical protein
VDGEPIGNGVRRIPTALEGEEGRQQKVFRIATFTGAWAIGATNTVNVTNLFFPLTTTLGTQAHDCAIAKEGTAWFLIDVPFETATAVFVSATATGVLVSATATQAVVSDVQISATLNTSNCAITVSRVQTTASVSVVQSTATAVVISSTFTSTFIRFKVS